jgi:hypothetical protein
LNYVRKYRISPIDFSEEFEEINSRQRLRSIALARVENANNGVALQTNNSTPEGVSRDRGFVKFV